MLKKSSILPLALALNLLVLLVMIARPIDQLDGALLLDDTFLALELSRNIADGNGPLYGTDYTNGFQPLYVFLCVPFFWLTSDANTPIYLSLMMLALFNTAGLYYLLKILRFHSSVTILFAAMLWIFNPLILLNTLNGLESAIALFSIIFALHFIIGKQYLNFSHTYVTDFKLGLIFGFALLARIDSGFLMVSLLLFMLHALAIGRVTLKRFFVSGIFILLGTMLLYSLWMIYSYHYTGLIYPISGKAAVMQSTDILDIERDGLFQYIPMISHAAVTIIKFNLASIVTVILLIAGSVFLTKKVKLHLKREVYILIIFVFILLNAYIFHAHVYWFYHRYILPISLVFIIINAALFSNIEVAISQKMKFALIAFISLISITSATQMKMFSEAYYNDTKIGYGEAGRWANSYFETGTIIGASQSGGIAYYADDLTVINLDGVVNQHAYEALKSKQIMDYILAAGIEYLLLWDSDYEYLLEHSSGKSILEYQFALEEFTTLGRQWKVYKVKKEP